MHFSKVTETVSLVLHNHLQCDLAALSYPEMDADSSPLKSGEACDRHDKVWWDFFLCDFQGCILKGNAASALDLW